MDNHDNTSITGATEKDLDAWLAMSADLWPEYDTEELKKVFGDVLASEKAAVLVYRLAWEEIGFIYMGIRTDYVEGSDSSPVGYVEGVYVKPNYRRKGIAEALLAAGERWASGKGCRQVGSDIYIDNKESYEFHTGVGFKEAGRLVAFIKDIG